MERISQLSTTCEGTAERLQQHRVRRPASRGTAARSLEASHCPCYVRPRITPPSGGRPADSAGTDARLHHLRAIRAWRLPTSAQAAGSLSVNGCRMMHHCISAFAHRPSLSGRIELRSQAQRRSRTRRIENVPSLTVERAADYTPARRGPLRIPAVQFRIARSALPVDDGPSRCGFRRAAIIRYSARPAS
jgi:hypothetical protein